MLSDEVIEKVTERIVNRLEQGNTYILSKMGEDIKAIRSLTKTEAMQLVQTLKYGGDYNKIVKELAKITKLNVKDIKDIFREFAKKDYEFAEQFYKYRGIGYIPFEENTALQNEVNAIANITARRYAQMMSPKVLGFGFVEDGEMTFKGLKQTYYDLLDEAVLNVSEGKETFDQAMSRQIKQMGGSGLKVMYESGLTRRLDSSVRMNLKDSLRDLHNELQDMFGNEFGADGVEISVHLNPAPDHEDVQGKQFRKEEFEHFQNDEKAISYDGIEFEPEIDGKDRRAISQYNCYHYTFSIILGINSPEYTNDQLQAIKDMNNEGFEIDGKHYTRYEGTQMQRQLETRIREQKDIQIMARASNNEEAIRDSQKKITQLTAKYKELSNKANLPTKMDRLKVSGYNRIKLQGNNQPKPILNGSDLMLETSKSEKTFNFTDKQEELQKKDIVVDSNVNDLDKNLVEKNLKHLEKLNDKYNVVDQQYLKLEQTYKDSSAIATTYYADNKIELNSKYFKGNKLIEIEKTSQDYKWHNKIKEEDLDIYTITHEYGHAVENNYTRKYIKRVYGIDTSQRRTMYKYSEKDMRREIDKDIRDSIFKEVQEKENISVTEIKNKYFSGYAKSKRNFEWFAETFTEMELGEKNNLTEAMRNWLERNY